MMGKVPIWGQSIVVNSGFIFGSGRKKQKKISLDPHPPPKGGLGLEKIVFRFFSRISPGVGRFGSAM
jgi:hypothetical protein